MYRQIRLHPDDQLYQLIVWRENTSMPISTYKLTTVTYGMNTSPYLAIKTLNQLAIDEGHSFPKAAEVLTTQTYVDDIITGAENDEDALQLQNQLISLLKKGGFELRKWVSNSDILLQSVPEEHLESPVFLQASDQPHFSILGIHWSPTDDSFSYLVDVPHCVPTKRHILSVIAKIYDPVGFLSPVIMWAKCFMQLLWTQKLEWDDPLPQDLSEKWQRFSSELHVISQIKIPRPFQFSQSYNIELHGFSDASESGFSAVIYFRCQLSDGTIVTKQVISKTRVSPLKKVTLPRLELCAAHLLAQLVSYCISIFSTKYKFSSHHLWCDSTIVLTWLQTPPYKLKTYVANRVAQTQELVPSHWWNHVSSICNPADCASRGILPSQLPDHSLWWNGPSWLCLDKDKWPISQFTPLDLSSSDETKQIPLTVLTASEKENLNLINKFSSWTKLIRVTAYVLRFIHNSSKDNNKLVGPLSCEELKASTNNILRLVQMECFAQDITMIKQGKTCTSKICRLSPFLDADGLLRVGGRLKNSSITFDPMHPILLPKKHHVTNILIDHYHLRHLHSGPQLTQAMIAQKFWILSARSAIRSRIFKCVTCFKNKPRNKTPLMGDLPQPRVKPARPFLSTGIDYGGPFNIKIHNLRAIRQIKVYICVFVCLVTKAVHIEVVTDLTTEAFIAALTRFVSRRGLCSDIYSDCGTNFVGANTALKKIVNSNLKSQDAKKKIEDFVSQQNITFHFNPPAAPHQGGLWESAIKSAKYHLRRVIGEHILTLSEFMTLVTQVEAMLNSRPLTPLSNDPEHLNALTPGHFLIGAPLAAVPEPKFDSISTNRLKNWQLVQSFNQRIWKRWQLEYLHTLQQRSKWTTPTTNLKIGDLVLVHSPSPPITWPLARIINVYPGKDGVVRVVQLKTQNNIITRPVVKVCPLPIN